MNNDILTVSQLNFYIRSILENDDALSCIFISAEISNFTDHYKSGHLYFSLKDNKATVKAVMFAGFAKRLKFKPENGMKVVVKAKVSLYEVTGQYQLYVEDIKPEGIGELTIAFEQLKERLETEGMFSNSAKKNIPYSPKRIGVITSDTGAAVRDIQNVLKRRYPLSEMILCPVLVQGIDAPKQIIDAIERFNKISACDVLILGRGGGTIEDLWAFNDERVARAIFCSEIPVISAVGHETDFTIADFVADLRAPTPSAAAELAVPDINDILDKIVSYYFSILKNIKLLIKDYNSEVSAMLKCLKNNTPYKIIEEKRIYLDLLESRMKNYISNDLLLRKEKFTKINSKFEMLNPIKTLERGYTIVIDDNKKQIKNIENLKINQNINIKFYDGNVLCAIKNINKIKE